MKLVLALRKTLHYLLKHIAHLVQAAVWTAGLDDWLADSGLIPFQFCKAYALPVGVKGQISTVWSVYTVGAESRQETQLHPFLPGPFRWLQSIFGHHDFLPHESLCLTTDTCAHLERFLTKTILILQEVFGILLPDFYVLGFPRVGAEISGC